MSGPPISFARGAPAPELIAAEDIAACVHAVALREGPSLFSYGPGGGYRPLRELLAGWHGVAPEQVVLTMGGLLGFTLYAAEALGRRPGRVLVEGPCYDRPLKVLAREGAEVVSLSMDAEGVEPEALEAELERLSEPPSFLYLIPTFQNPSGRTLSLERRRRIVELVSEHGVPVLEDDPYGLVRFEGEPQPSLRELEGGRLVSHTSSFSKTVAPGLRTAYFVLPEAEAAAFEARATDTYISPPFLVQAAVAELMARGRFEPNLARARAELRLRRDAMLEALEAFSPEGATWSRPEGGYFVWLELGAERDASALAARAEERGVLLVRGEDFFPRGSGLGRSSARLAFSYETPARIAEGIERLALLL